MNVGIFMRGVLFGLALAAPVGPIGVLCIRRTLTHGRAYGLVTGIGAATADATYGAIAGLGLAMVGAWLLRFGGVMQVLGGCFLCYLGVTTFRARPTEASAHRSPNLLTAYLSTFLLTIANPLTILSFGAMFASMGVIGGGIVSTAALVSGVFAGSACWWVVLTSGVGILRRHVDKRMLIWINRIPGTAITIFGLAAVIHGI